MTVADYRLAAIGCRYIGILIQQALKLRLDSPCNQVTGTLSDQVVQRVIGGYFWL
ncbi:hypothetical protein GCM10011533_36890 [Streptosporangium jomthongense]|jgi:hypothetical protein|nr:hypothetical protein GCM10011533_36890 [Streptosporangium jomthongense]